MQRREHNVKRIDSACAGLGDLAYMLSAPYMSFPSSLLGIFLALSFWCSNMFKICTKRQSCRCRSKSDSFDDDLYQAFWGAYSMMNLAVYFFIDISLGPDLAQFTVNHNCIGVGYLHALHTWFLLSWILSSGRDGVISSSDNKSST